MNDFRGQAVLCSLASGTAGQTQAGFRERLRAPGHRLIRINTDSVFLETNLSLIDIMLCISHRNCRDARDHMDIMRQSSQQGYQSPIGVYADKAELCGL